MRRLPCSVLDPPCCRFSLQCFSPPPSSTSVTLSIKSKSWSEHTMPLLASVVTFPPPRGFSSEDKAAAPRSAEADKESRSPAQTPLMLSLFLPSAFAQYICTPKKKVKNLFLFSKTTDSVAEEREAKATEQQVLLLKALLSQTVRLPLTGLSFREAGNLHRQCFVPPPSPFFHWERGRRISRRRRTRRRGKRPRV